MVGAHGVLCQQRILASVHGPMQCRMSSTRDNCKDQVIVNCNRKNEISFASSFQQSFMALRTYINVRISAFEIDVKIMFQLDKYFINTLHAWKKQ